MCRSVPQMEAARTRTRTSPGRAAGTSTLSICAPGSGRGFRSACIFGMDMPLAGPRRDANTVAGSIPNRPDRNCHAARILSRAVGFRYNRGHCFFAGRTLGSSELSIRQRLEEIRTGFEPAFWLANVSELFERLAYYGAFSSLANYLHETLQFSVEQTGSLTGFFGGLVWFLAIVGGALADRLGFRRALSLAYLVLTCAYFLLGSIGAPWMSPLRDSVPLWWLVLFILMLPALGISLVKPCVVGTTARASAEN